MTGFRIEVRPAKGRITLAVTGELDIATAPELSAALGRALGEGARDVVVDLSETTFIDSSGLRALGQGANRQPDRDVRLAVVCPPHNRVVLRVIELVGLDYALLVVGSEDELDGSGPVPGPAT